MAVSTQMMLSCYGEVVVTGLGALAIGSSHNENFGQGDNVKCREGMDKLLSQ